MSKYVNNEKKYEDLSSSASAFLVVGVLGFAFALLCQFGVLPLPVNLSDQPMMFVTIVVLSLAFLVLGIVSVRQAGQVKGSIAGEKAETVDLINWFLKTYDSEKLDAAAYVDPEAKDEVNALLRLETIKQLLLEKSSSITEERADALSEEILDQLEK